MLIFLYVAAEKRRWTEGGQPVRTFGPKAIMGVHAWLMRYMTPKAQVRARAREHRQVFKTPWPAPLPRLPRTASGSLPSESTLCHRRVPSTPSPHLQLPLREWRGAVGQAPHGKHEDTPQSGAYISPPKGDVLSTAACFPGMEPSGTSGQGVTGRDEWPAGPRLPQSSDQVPRGTMTQDRRPPEVMIGTPTPPTFFKILEIADAGAASAGCAVHNGMFPC